VVFLVVFFTPILVATICPGCAVRYVSVGTESRARVWAFVLVGMASNSRASTAASLFILVY